jgi:hypothetical protein
MADKPNISETKTLEQGIGVQSIQVSSDKPRYRMVKK